jgi:hypothetical protein
MKSRNMAIIISLTAVAAIRAAVVSQCERAEGIVTDGSGRVLGWEALNGGAVLQAMAQGVDLHGLFSTRLLLW